MGGWAWDDEPSTPEAEWLIANSGRIYDRIAEIVDRVRVDPSSFSVTPELVCEFHRIATDGEKDLRKPPGLLRSEDVQLGRVVVQRVHPLAGRPRAPANSLRCDQRQIAAQHAAARRCIRALGNQLGSSIR